METRRPIETRFILLAGRKSPFSHTNRLKNDLGPLVSWSLGFRELSCEKTMMKKTRVLFLSEPTPLKRAWSRGPRDQDNESL